MTEALDPQRPEAVMIAIGEMRCRGYTISSGNSLFRSSKRSWPEAGPSRSGCFLGSWRWHLSKLAALGCSECRQAPALEAAPPQIGSDAILVQGKLVCASDMAFCNPGCHDFPRRSFKGL